MTPSEEAFRLLGVADMPDYATRATETEVAAGLIKHAIDPSGSRLLLVPVSETDDDVEDQRSKGISVETGPLLEEERESRYIFVRCDDNSLLDLFSTVCDEIIEGCATHPDQAGSVVRLTLQRWRELLGPGGGRLLSDSEIKGLLAELHLMEELAATSPERALARWTGADRSRHDFSGPELACEVKASAVVDEVRVRIHGLAQLQPPTGGRLLLRVERFERTPVGGDSVPEAVDRLVLLGVDQNGLFLKLNDVGAQPRDFKVYRKIRFKTLETRGYEVDSSFPRLVPSLLIGTPAEGRVHAVDYVVDLAASPPQPLSHVAWAEAISSLLADGAM